MLTLSPPQIVPLTEAPSQIVNVTLGGQDCRINIYTKSLNVPIEPPNMIPAVPVEMATFSGVITAGTMTAIGVVGTIQPGAVIGGSGLALPTYVASGPVTGGDGIYIVTPAQNVGIGSMTASSAAEPVYENINPVFLDLYVGDALIIGGVICYNEAMILIDPYLGFIGDLAMIDTQKNDDPQGAPLRLPPPDLRNFWQRNLPISLGGKLPPALANKIPGLGSRFLLTYWPNLR